MTTSPLTSEWRIGLNKHYRGQQTQDHVYILEIPYIQEIFPKWVQSSELLGQSKRKCYFKSHWMCEVQSLEILNNMALVIVLPVLFYVCQNQSATHESSIISCQLPLTSRGKGLLLDKLDFLGSWKGLLCFFFFPSSFSFLFGVEQLSVIIGKWAGVRGNSNTTPE